MTVNSVLLGLLCFYFVFSQSTETAGTSKEIKQGVYREEDDIVRSKFFQITREKPYILEPWTGTASPPPHHSSPFFIMLLIIALFAMFLFVSCFFCWRWILTDCDGSYSKSQSHPSEEADITVTVLSPLPITKNILAQSHLPPSRRNQFPGSEIGDFPRTSFPRPWWKVIEQDSNHASSDRTGKSFTYPNYSSSLHNSGISNIVGGKTPDFSTGRPCWNSLEFNRNHGTSHNPGDSFAYRNYASSSQGLVEICNTVEENIRGYSTSNPGWNAIDSNHAAPHNSEDSFIYPNHTSSLQDTAGTSNTFDDKPPDYSTVMMNDLINFNKASIPAIKKNNESPPE